MAVAGLLAAGKLGERIGSLKREILKIASVVSLAALVIGVLLSWWGLATH